MVASLELFQVIKEASDGRPTTKNPLFQSSQFPILFLSFGDSTAVIKYKENGFINSSLTLCEKTWISRDDTPGTGPELQRDTWLESILGKQDTWVLAIYSHSRKSELFQATFPSHSRSASSQNYLLLKPIAFQLQNPFGLIHHKTWSNFRGSRERWERPTVLSLNSPNVQGRLPVHASLLTSQPSSSWGRRSLRLS